jgi:anti-sigma factor RsiW
MNTSNRGPRLTVHCQEIVELVTDYLEGALDPEMTAEVEAHLELCDGCDTYVEQMRTTVRALGRLPVESLSEDAQAELVRAFRDLRGPAAFQ